MEPDIEQRLDAALADVVELREDLVALVLETRVHAPDDELLQLNREAFVILSIDPDAMGALRESSRFGRYDVNDFDDATFEVLDGRGKLLAFGDHGASAAPWDG